MIISAAFVLAGCGAPHEGNKDPRKGRVTIDSSNCFNACYWDWEICQGPDLVVHIDSDDVKDRTITNSLECRP